MQTNKILTIGSSIFIITSILGVTILALNEVEIPDILYTIIMTSLGFLGGLKIPSDNNKDS